ncbi:MAG: glutamate synthase large subunit [Bifidobacteriaceae bacterium]|jgi:glutamate synthase (NADPH/NADH) large chain|nr:glutamate synthase large subunit [Bifidobacteriaceae bacterium]
MPAPLPRPSSSSTASGGLQAPRAQGLYDPAFEHDACGVAFVATLRGEPGRDIIDQAFTVLRNLDHRGAVGAEPNTGDGAGILTQMPDALMRGLMREDIGLELPARGHYAVGAAFLPQDQAAALKAVAVIEGIVKEEGLEVLGWRDVPTVPDPVGPTARASMPAFKQLAVAAPGAALGGIDLDRKCYRVVKRAGHEAGVYFASLSARTIVYKGMLTTSQLVPFFPDLQDQRYASEIALVHSRFSTNTFPSWQLAQPFSVMAHNGEINTVMGNRNWIKARQGQMVSQELGDIAPLTPICAPGESDSASFNSVLELLSLAGRSMPHAVLMMVPEAWENNHEMDASVRDFYEYHSCVAEAWDGPACIAFTDGRYVGATLDRNGLRPGRYWVTKDGLVVLASESGVLDLAPETVVRKGRLEPGRIFLVDTEAGRIVENSEVKQRLAQAAPYGQWLGDKSVRLSELPPREHIQHSQASVERRQQTFGYTTEELKMILTPMAQKGAEPTGAMGNDTPLAVLSNRPRQLFDYFNQLFAQVTNPPLDAIREELVTSLEAVIGPMPNLLATDPDHARKLFLQFPVIDNDDLAKIVRIDRYGAESGGFSSTVIRGVYAVAGGGAALEARLREIFEQVDAAVQAGVSFIVLSDRESNAELAPIPSLLLTSAVHHHLLRNQTRTKIGLVIEAGDVRETHHVALLIGYGAAAVNPYLAMESVERLARAGALGNVTPDQAVANLIKALGKGVLKIMSKMGISTVGSYRGAQVFEAVGLSQELVDRYFTGTPSRIGGIGLDELAEEVARRHAVAYPPSGIAPAHRVLDVGGQYKWRREGEDHLLDPDAIFLLQNACWREDPELYKRYAARVDDQSERLMTLRGLFRMKDQARHPIPLDQVEPAEAIMRRFTTGAMSFGSISAEAHETLARALNSIGAKSNTGEGGEATERLHDPERRSAIKQVASGRFGVTAEYLTNADDIQIKMAQGAKPGEGGQLPGPKVYPWVAEVRHSTPGVALISPPPHHDIYSIEDLKQLIHDLKNANPEARIHVKLVSEVGVGTVAAGVSKAHADVVLISGADGGTGASPLSSMKHAGAPWELGLAETQQTLLLNNLRDRIVVQVDGQLKTGRDVMIAALLGAEEYGFATMPLVSIGCVMMRKCNLDTCPVGIATQNPDLRARFKGKPEYVVTYFRFVAEQVRGYLAELGFKTLHDAIGHVEVIEPARAVTHWKAKGLDLSPILHKPEVPAGASLCHSTAQDHGLDQALDNELIKLAAPALERGEKVAIDHEIHNVNRTVGTMLGHELVKRYGGQGLEPGTIDITLHGSAGQSFGAFLPRGITLRLIGDSNDYLGKGLSGGVIAIRPHPDAAFTAQDNVIAGNVIGYGATSGKIFLSGKVGERFGVRNSGASLVVEGTGDHACEYMTGGVAVILGRTGRNLGAGMSGGRAFVVDLNPARVTAGSLESGALMTETLDVLDAEGFEEDVKLFTDLLAEHTEATGSRVGADLMAQLRADRAGTLRRVTRIIPRDFARMNEQLAHADAEGLDYHDPQVWDSIMEEVSRG